MGHVQSYTIRYQIYIKYYYMHTGPALRFGLPKPVPILVAYLLLNIKERQKKKKKIIQNQGYIVLLV